MCAVSALSSRLCILRLMSKVFITWGLRCTKRRPICEGGHVSTHQEVFDGQCLRVQLLDEEIWKPLNIPTGIFPSPFGNRQQRLSGEISFALSQSEKFLGGILVLGKRNQTLLTPSGPWLLVKHSESQFGWSSLGPWGGRRCSSGVQRISPVAKSLPPTPTPDWRKREISVDRVTSV